MVLLVKITWKEFEKIIQILKSYKQFAMKINNEDGVWFDKIVFLLSKTLKQPFNVEVPDLEKEDCRRIVVIVDMWNIVKNSLCFENRTPYDYETDKISRKLQGAYFQAFSDHVYPHSSQ
jgi:hypothetical protein